MENLVNPQATFWRGKRVFLNGHQAPTWTVSWHRRVAAGADARMMMLEQIDQYRSLGNP